MAQESARRIARSMCKSKHYRTAPSFATTTFISLERFSPRFQKNTGYRFLRLGLNQGPLIDKPSNSMGSGSDVRQPLSIAPRMARGVENRG
jgi:hypothetical protein